MSTLEKSRPILLPVKLARCHKQALAGREINSSVVLARQEERWWLTLSYNAITWANQLQAVGGVVTIDAPFRATC